VHVRQLLNLAAPVAAGVMLVSPLTAQAPPPAPPQVTVGGVVYGQFQYDLKDSVGAAGVSTGHQNQFSIKRAYINVIGRFGGGLQTRVTGDIAPVGVGNQVFRLKYAYAAWTPTNSSLTYKFGLTQTPWLDWEEALWDYRMQGQMPLERAGYGTAADFGFGIDGRWNNDQVNAQFTVVNGEGYSGGTGDKRKDAQLRVSVRVMDTDDASRVGGLRVTGYAGVGKRTGGGDRNRFIGMISYKSKQFTLAGEYIATKDTVSPVAADSLNLGGGASATGSVLSAYGVFHFTNSPVAAIARVDVTDPNTSTSPNKLTRFIGGLSYQVNANVRMLADVDLLSFEATPSNATTATRQQALVQMQFTF
jgi:hypothetical protein